jgi:hypothetical protein
MTQLCEACKFQFCSSQIILGNKPCCFDCLKEISNKGELNSKELIIKESFPHSFLRILFSQFVFLTAITFWFTIPSLLIWAYAKNNDLEETFYIGLFIVLFVSPFIFLKVLFKCLLFVKNRPEVIAKNEKLLVNLGNQEFWAGDSKTCLWRKGNLLNVHCFHDIFFLGGEVFLLFLPREKIDEMIVGVGFSKESQQIWNWYFEENEIPLLPTARPMRHKS